MKKIVVSVSLLLAILMCFSFVACDSANGKEKEGNHSSTQSISEQPLLGVKSFQAVPQSQLKLSNSINLSGNYYLWFFDLGMVYGTPIYCSEINLFNYNYEVEFTFEKLTSSQFQNNVSKAHETVNTHSYTGGFEIKAAQEFSFEESAELGVSATVGMASASASMGVTNKQSFSFGESTDHHWTNNWGGVDTESNSITESYLETFSEKKTVRIAFSEDQGYTKGHYYRMAYYDGVHTYGVLIYDVSKGTYTYAFSEFMVPDQRICVIEESETGIFSYQIDKQLEFDLDTAVAIAQNNIPPLYETPVKEEIQQHSEYKNLYYTTPSNKLIIDFTEYQEGGSISDFQYNPKYYQNGVLTINPMVDGWDIYQVEIRGLYLQTNPENGDTFVTVFENFSIQFSDLWQRSPILILKNIAFTSCANVPAISSPVDLTISVEGTNKITAADGQDAVSCPGKKVTVIGSGTLEATGGKGADGATPGADGQTGRSAIVAENVVIDMTGTLTVVGGNGGNGAIGATGQDGATNDNITFVQDVHTFFGHVARINRYDQAYNGEPGGNGGNGGTGGAPINSVNVDVKQSKIVFQYGNGGNGGNGGKGGDGGKGHDYYGYVSGAAFIWAYDPGKGGNGGNGGDGGNGGAPSAVTYPSFENTTVQSGSNGTDGVGGAGGSAGAGGKGGSTPAAANNHTAEDAEAGQPGVNGKSKN